MRRNECAHLMNSAGGEGDGVVGGVGGFNADEVLPFVIGQV